MNTTTNKRRTTTAVRSDNSEVETPVVKKGFEPYDEIMTTSVTAGELIMIGRKSGRYYRWSGYGDTSPIEYQDLRAELYLGNSSYIFKPYFLIEDADYLALPEAKKIQEFYDTFFSISDVDKIFDLDGPSFEKTIKKLPKGILNSFKAIAAQKIQNGSLDSLNKIKTIDALLGTDLFNSYVAVK